MKTCDYLANGVIEDSLNEIAAHINTLGTGVRNSVPVLVFNPLSWPRTEVIEVDAQLPVQLGL